MKMSLLTMFMKKIDQIQMTNKRLNPKNLANQDRKGFNLMKMIHVKIFEDIVKIQMFVMTTKVSLGKQCDDAGYDNSWTIKRFDLHSA